jgi:hypothetical protein
MTPKQIDMFCAGGHRRNRVMKGWETDTLYVGDWARAVCR